MQLPQEGAVCLNRSGRRHDARPSCAHASGQRAMVTQLLVSLNKRRKFPSNDEHGKRTFVVC